MSKDFDLTERQLEFLHALLNHPTVRLAAEAVSVPEVVGCEWAAEPEFRRALYSLRLAELGHAGGVAAHSAGSILLILVGIIGNERTEPLVRVQASAAVLDFTARMLELESRLQQAKE